MAHKDIMSDKDFWNQFPSRNRPYGEHRTVEQLREKNQRVHLKRKAEGKDRQYHAALKYEVLEHYGNGSCTCVRCGFSDIRALSIDHINSDSKSKRISSYRLYLQLRRDGYPEGYQTLCMNCQFIKRMENHESRT